MSPSGSLRNLIIDSIELPPGSEWNDAGGGWRFLQLRKGSAYWLSKTHNRPLNEGETLVLAPSSVGDVRASQLGEVTIAGFRFEPNVLTGFLTLSEREFFKSEANAPRTPIEILPSNHLISKELLEKTGAREKVPILIHRLEMLRLGVSWFAGQLTRQVAAGSSNTSAMERFHNLITKMPEKEMIHHTIEELAHFCACSPRHFNRLFRAAFGTSARSTQTELRLTQASQLLARTNEKIINVALDSGYRNLSIFNALFKRKFGVTPSRWRHQNRPEPQLAPPPAKTKRSVAKNVIVAIASAVLLLGGQAFADPVPEPGATNSVIPLVGQTVLRDALHKKISEASAEAAITRIIPSVGTTNTAQLTNGQFQVRGYEIAGNTILPSDSMRELLVKYAGKPQTLESIREGLAALQNAYRERGFVTVSVTLPPQQLTNGIVKVQVVEGTLAEINVINNRHFSSNNVMRELPSLKTNIVLNNLVFQQELDRANANRDRQIYPVIAPGPEPGTSILDLKVKDRLPLHAHMDINNYSTPNTPELRANLALVDNNLWQLNHQAGFQYSFSPEALKSGSYRFYDQPLIANYSTFYRLPFNGMNGPADSREYAYGDFGFDEATKRFKAPPPTGTSELLFYASRSFSDSGEQIQTHNLYPNPLPPTGGIQIDEKIINRTLNPNETIGGRFNTPLHEFIGIASTFSMGADFKNYRSTLDQNHTFRGTLYVPAFGNTGPPWDPPGGFQSPPTNTTRTVFNEAQYLPVTFGWEGSRPDRFGSISMNLNESFNLAGFNEATKDFRAVAGSMNTDARYLVVTAGLTREQKLPADWTLRMHADGQWANQPLISNEQFALGGLAGVRGYRDGTEYGDLGWRTQLDLKTPFANAGLVFDKFPMIVRAYTFADYGERYLLDPGARKSSVNMLGVGGGLDLSIGEHFDLHALIGVPLLDTPARDSGHVRVAFSIGTQF